MGPGIIQSEGNKWTQNGCGKKMVTKELLFWTL